MAFASFRPLAFLSKRKKEKKEKKNESTFNYRSSVYSTQYIRIISLFYIVVTVRRDETGR